MIEKRTLVGLKISYRNDEMISITEFLGRGASCSTYKGYHLDSKGNKKNIVVVKEFVPNKEEYNFDINVSGEPISLIEIQDKVFKHRYLPAKTAEFKKDFVDFFERQKKVQSMANSILNSDTENRYLRYNIVSLNEQDIIKEFDENNNTYKGLLIYNYDSIDFGNGIKDLTVIERLEAFLCLCSVVNAFHKANIALIDIKPENFIYISEKDASPMTYLKFFDFDSFVYLDENSLMIDDCSSIPCGTFPFEAPELAGTYREYRIYDDVGARSDVYSLGVILYNFIIYDVINEYKEFKDKEKFYSHINSENDFLVGNGQNILTDGFIKKLFSILNKACYRYYNQRYKDEGYAKGLLTDVENLLEIYQNKGVHPEVMLDNAKTIATEFKNELKDFDEGLLCDCVVVDDETE